MYWGVKINGDVNEYADALSRFKNYDWNALGLIMINAIDVVNKYLLLLAQAPPNRDKKYWSWTEEQKEFLRINATTRLINNKKSNRTRAKNKTDSAPYNILTRKNFDE